jgi:formylglycine-generating enzyme required for sulfatase activity
MDIRKPISFNLSRTSSTAQGYIEPPFLFMEVLPLHMILIPGGTFLMGSPEDELERYDREGPQQKVTVAQFFMGRYPVTQAQWRFVTELPQIAQSLNPNPSDFRGENHPVENVSWHDAIEFCARLSQYTKRPYRLPTEAEWEYACRAHMITPFYFGKTITDEVTNYRAIETYANGPIGEYRGTTTPVDHFGIANAFGLSDMHGNVWEWCQDTWAERWSPMPTGSLDPQEKSARGGSWYSGPSKCRSACRFHFRADAQHNDLGFRVACAAPRN